MKTPILLVLLAVTLVLACATTAPRPATQALSVDAAQAEGTVEIVTVDADGGVRETPIWILGYENAIYIRTSGSRWHGNIQRDPNVVIRIAGSEYPLRAENVADKTLRDELTQAFRTKYGFSDALIGIFRGSSVNILRLLPR